MRLAEVSCTLVERELAKLPTVSAGFTCLCLSGLGISYLDRYHLRIASLAARIANNIDMS